MNAKSQTHSKRTFIIAEAGVNHNASLDMAAKLIDVAADAGADAVKFQTFRADRLVSAVAPKARYQIENMGQQETHYEMIKRLELRPEDHRALMNHCASRGIRFMSSPFDVESMKVLALQLDLPLLKLGSGELTNAELLLETARTGRELILSTGMGTLADVENALGILAFGYGGSSERPSRDAFRRAFLDPASRAAMASKVRLLHCTTQYPAPDDAVNLTAMSTLRTAFGLPVGYSDHTMGIAVSLAAVALGADIIEKHFTLDRTLPGPDHKASLEPHELKALVQGIRSVEAALGDGLKQPSAAEQPNMPIARKSLHARVAIREGESFTAENLCVLRPGDGVSAMDYWDVLGTKAHRSFEAGEKLVART